MLSLNKRDILSVFLNTKYYGGNIYGVGAASLVYLGKNLRELTLAERATLLAMFNYNLQLGLPQVHRLRQSQEYVLKRLLEREKIGPKAYEEAIQQELHVVNYVSRESD